MNGNEGSNMVLEPEILPPEQIPVPAITSVNEVEALAERFLAEAKTDLSLAERIQVTDDETYQQAGQLRVAIDRKKKGGEGVISAVCDDIYQRWKRFRTVLMAPVDTRDQAIKLLSSKRLTYEREQERKAEAERQRLEAEASKEQERLNRLALEKAARAEARGDVARAEEILETVPIVPTPVAPVLTPPKTKGVAKVTYWFAEILGCNGTEYAKVVKANGPASVTARQSFAALVTAVAAGEVPLEALLPNESWLTKTAGSLMHNMHYAGVRVWSEEREKSTGR